MSLERMKGDIGLWRIHIEKDGNRYKFIIDNPKTATILTRVKQKIPSNSRKKVLDSFDRCLSVLSMARGSSNEKSINELFEQEPVSPQELGSMIYKYMIPTKCRDALDEIDSEYVRISTDDVEIPWELIHDGKEFFSIKNAVGRTVEASSTIPTLNRPSMNVIKVLLIGNPTCDLDAAEKEIDILSEFIGSMDGTEVDVLKGKEANMDNITFDYLGKNYYDIIHYAGHTEFEKGSYEESSLQLYDGELSAQYLFDIIDVPPRLVYLNSCESSKSSKIEYWEKEGKVTGLAGSFISAGVDNYIGSLWEVSDKISHYLSKEFYRELFNGNRIGFALKNAKKKTVEEYNDYFSPSSFILYGDPTNIYKKNGNGPNPRLQCLSSILIRYLQRYRQINSN